MPDLSKRSVRTNQIIDAAGKLFARQGYHGTTTRQIAHLAGVGENTLFRQFDHKEGLFWSTLRHHSAGLTLRRDLQEGLARRDPPEVMLPKIIDLLTDTESYKPELLQMIAVAFLELHWKAELFANESLSPVLSAISQYLEANINSGRLRGSDATMLTAALTMTTLMHPEISTLINRNKFTYRNTQEAGRAYARFWLDLLVPANATVNSSLSAISAEREG